MSYQPVIAEEYRASVLENIHQGAICIIDEDKKVVYAKGNVQMPIFYRSAMKPLQAIPVFRSGIIEKYSLRPVEAALFTASQRGESYHVAHLQNLSKKLQIDEEQLICHASYPLNEAPKQDYISKHLPKRKLLHNCAGKHLGFLAYAREKGYDMGSYDAPDHPLQLAIKRLVSELSETDQSEMLSGMDGCGVPVHAVPLKNMAVSYLKFANPAMIADRKTAQAVNKISQTMGAHPEIVASRDFICTVLLADHNIVAKGGAMGVYCLALKKEKISIALKVHSGTEHLWPQLIAVILKKINYSNLDTIDRLQKLCPKEIRNDNGQIVGEIKILL